METNGDLIVDDGFYKYPGSRIQLSIDYIMVSNGIVMQNIMKATQLEAKITQGMAKKTQEPSESMRQDSLSMKTVRISLKRVRMSNFLSTSKSATLTMFFLSSRYILCSQWQTIFSFSKYLTHAGYLGHVILRSKWLA